MDPAPLIILREHNDENEASVTEFSGEHNQFLSRAKRRKWDQPLSIARSTTDSATRKGRKWTQTPSAAQEDTDEFCQKYNRILKSANNGNGPNIADSDRTTTGFSQALKLIAEAAQPRSSNKE